MSRSVAIILAGSLFILSTLSFADGTKVFAAVAQRNQFVDRVEALGSLRANESVTISSTITETITAIHFDDGDRVKAGQVLVEMTGKEERAMLEEMKAVVSESRRQYNRVKSLASKGTEAKSLLDQRRREWHTAKARLKAIESRLADHTIRAPFSGIVGMRNVSLGALVEPGDIITTLDDDSVMKLDFQVPSVYLVHLKTGLKIEARSAAFTDRTFQGEVKSVDSRIDPVSRSIRVRAILPNPDLVLKPGMLMRVELLRNLRMALVIPEKALISLREDQYVYVIKPGPESRVERRKVIIGGRRPGDVEVLEGLTEGERIVTEGSFKLQPGETVKVQAMENGDNGLPELLSLQPNGKGDVH